ncbi:hypothetical protein D9C73_011228 [Scomber scombrus]|uniref:Uncharacterized protein n=1 Tax=Scomber scombrus TaxID=13677 RepID=A0AAV1N7V1_SCOSC
MLLERCDGSAPFQRTEFLRQHQGQSVGRSDRQIAERQAGRAAEYQVCPAAAESLAQPRGEQRLLGMPTLCPDCRLALAPLIG